MINTLEVLKYLTLNNPISKNKLEKILYLIDWFSCLKYQRKITKFEWKSENGPKAKNLNKLINDSNIFIIEEKNEIKYIKFQENNLNKIKINNEDKLIIDYVLEKTKNMNIKNLNEYAMSSYPFQSSTRYYDLNLEELAKEYKKD